MDVSTESGTASTAQVQLLGVGMHYGHYTVLEGLDLTTKPGDFIAIEGPSGSGKSTLLSLIGLLETPTSGEYLLHSESVRLLDDQTRSRLRNKTFGFVFQQFSLIPELTAWQNVARPLLHAGVGRREQRDKAMALLEWMGMADCAMLRPAQLSGGQQQRVAIARALVNDPDIILADEPTGHLPRSQWEPILDMLDELHRDGKTVLVVTHNPDVARRAKAVLRLSGGELVMHPSNESPVRAVTRSVETTTTEVSEEGLRLRFLGAAEVLRNGDVEAATQRQADILALLAANRQGLSGDELLLLLYGDDGHPSTMKAALSKLRRVVPIGAQPYRVDEDVSADFLELRQALLDGRIDAALTMYRGPLLPRSRAPGVEELRTVLEHELRQAVLARGDGGQVFDLAERLRDDLEVWEEAVARLSSDDPRRALASGRVLRIQRDWS